MTYKGSTQTEATFYVGGSATGIYGVVRNFAKIDKTKIELITKDLYVAVSEASGSDTSPSSSVTLLSG
jgi:hypothetical protein